MCCVNNIAPVRNEESILVLIEILCVCVYFLDDMHV